MLIFSKIRTVFLSNILNLKNAKELNEELMLIVWHPSRWWDFWVSEDEKKEIDSIYLSVAYKMEILKHFVEKRK